MNKHLYAHMALFVVPSLLWALDADTAARLMRESARGQRAVQAEIQRMRWQMKNAPWVVTNAPPETAQSGKEIAVPDMKTPEDVDRFMKSPEMTETFGKVVEAFNAQLPALNAMMASNPVPGQSAAPLQPLTVGQFQRAIGAVARSGGDGTLAIPQFEALTHWQAAWLEKMTNRNDGVSHE